MSTDAEPTASAAHSVAARKRLERRNAAASFRKNRKRDEAWRKRLSEMPWTGVDWTASTMRPGCQDFLAVPSLQPNGDRKAHNTPTYACIGNTKEKANQGRD